MKKIILYLMNEKGLKVLEEIIAKFTESIIEFVVLSEDKNMKEDYFDKIVDLCKKKNIVFYNRKDDIPDYNYYSLSIGWRWIIRNTSKLIVFHDSILPKYRGFSPLPNMLINGEKIIGVTALYASEKYDNGDIIDQRKIEVEYPIKIADAIEIISKLYSTIAIEIIDKIINGIKISSSPQEHLEASYSVWRDYNDYFIDWTQDASLLKRFIDSVGYPYLGARTKLSDEEILIEEAEVINISIETKHVGKVIMIENGNPIIICGKNALKITKAKNSKGISIIPFKKIRVRFGE